MKSQGLRIKVAAKDYECAIIIAKRRKLMKKSLGLYYCSAHCGNLYTSDLLDITVHKSNPHIWYLLLHFYLKYKKAEVI